MNSAGTLRAKGVGSAFVVASAVCCTDATADRVIVRVSLSPFSRLRYQLHITAVQAPNGVGGILEATRTIHRSIRLEYRQAATLSLWILVGLLLGMDLRQALFTCLLTAWFPRD